MYVLRTGCQWKALPRERVGSASAIHKRSLEWEQAGFFEALWKAGLAEYDEMEGIAWRWQSIDGALMKAPLAQGTAGSMRRPAPSCSSASARLIGAGKHLCAGAGCRSTENHRTIEQHSYIAHAVDWRQLAERRQRNPGNEAWRWVVEVCHSWFSRFRKLPARCEELERSYVALNRLAATIIALRKVPPTMDTVFGWIPCNARIEKPFPSLGYPRCVCRP